MELYTIIAQLINFGVFIFLLNKFLYKPLLITIDKRRSDIKQKIEETQTKLEESNKLKEDYFNKLKEVEKENILLRKQALDDINKFKEIELQKAKDDISSKKEKFNDYLNLEQRSLVENFNENLSELFIMYLNNLLNVLANSNLQNEIVNNFLQKLDTLTEEKVQNINDLKNNIIDIFSNDILSDSEKKLINDFLIKKGFKFDNINFDINKNLILGIELKAKSYVLSWNVKELTTNFMSAIDKKIIEKK